MFVMCGIEPATPSATTSAVTVAPKHRKKYKIAVFILFNSLKYFVKICLIIDCRMKGQCLLYYCALK